MSLSRKAAWGRSKKPEVVLATSRCGPLRFRSRPVQAGESKMLSISRVPRPFSVKWRMYSVIPIFRTLPLQPTSRFPHADAKYRSLVDQLPAVVFMASLEGGIGDAYVSPQIEAALGFSQGEWLEDPLRWYAHIHPDDKERWSSEAAQLFVSGTALRSIYRVIARNGKVVWFQCEIKILRGENGQPYALHGVGFDITNLKEGEQTLSEKNKQLELLKDVATAANHATSVAGAAIRGGSDL